MLQRVFMRVKQYARAWNEGASSMTIANDN